MAGLPNTPKGIQLRSLPVPGASKVMPTGTYVIPAGTNGYALISDSTSATGFSWSLISGSGGSGSSSPTGPAGGDITGTYPNPTIGNNKVTPAKADLTQAWNFTGGLLSGSQAVVVTTDSRLSDSRSPSGLAGGDLTGSYPNPTLITTGVITGTYGSSTLVPVITVDSKGRLTNITSSTVTAAPSGPAGGDLTGTYPNPTFAIPRLALTGGAITGNVGISGTLSMSSHNITNVLDPVNNQDAATRSWVLAQVAARLLSLSAIFYSYSQPGTPIVAGFSSAYDTNGAFTVIGPSGSKIV